MLSVAFYNQCRYAECHCGYFVYAECLGAVLCHDNWPNDLAPKIVQAPREVASTNCRDGATTLNLATLSIVGLFATLSIVGLFATLSIVGLFATLSNNHIQHIDTQHSHSAYCVPLCWVSRLFKCYAECLYAECRCPECRGSLKTHDSQWQLTMAIAPKKI